MNIILGAGIAGLGAYCTDNSSYIFEQAPKAGGLCATLQSMASCLTKPFICHLPTMLS